MSCIFDFRIITLLSLLKQEQMSKCKADLILYLNAKSAWNIYIQFKCICTEHEFMNKYEGKGLAHKY